MISVFFASVIAFILSIITFPIVFYILFALGLAWLMWATERESVGGAFFATIFAGTLGVLQYGSFSGLLLAVKANPLIVGVAALAFFIIGTFWARFKWGMLVSDMAKEINDFITQFGIDAAVRHYSNRTHTEEEIRQTSFACLAPTVGSYKGRIVTWIILWIPSLTWFILNDPIRRIGNWIFENIKGYFQNVANTIFKKSFRIIPAPAIEEPGVVTLKQEEPNKWA